MSDDPNKPTSEGETPSVLPVQQPPRFAAPTAPTAPGIPSMMPPSPSLSHSAMPMQMPMQMPVQMPMQMPVQMPSPQPMMGAPFYPGAPTAPMIAAYPAPATPTPEGPVLGVRDFYQFGEEPVGQRVQVTILETPAMPPELPPPSKIDPGLEATRVALEAQLARNAIAALPYVPPTATRWFRFSPLELFMEHVLARRLWTVE